MRKNKKQNSKTELLKFITKCNLVYLNNKTLKDKKNNPEIDIKSIDLDDIEIISWERKTKTLHLKLQS